MVNSVILEGRVAGEVDMRYTPDGTGVARFDLAVPRPYKNAAGDRETDFFPIVVWRKMAEVCAEHMFKGQMVSVQGRLQKRRYETQDGNKRTVIEVIADRVNFLQWDNAQNTESFDDGGNY